MSESFTLKKIEYDGKLAARVRGLDDNGKVQKYIDSEVLRLCDPKVPFDTGALKQSGITHTTIGSGEVKYRTPYARRWYYMPADFTDSPERGNYWFDRMKKEGGRQQILRGAAQLAGGRV